MPHTRKMVVSLLVSTAFVLSSLVNAQDSQETEAEQGRALQAEQNPAAAATPPSGPGMRGVGPAGPLFAGVDDTAIGGFRIDVVGDVAVQAFTGFQVWGSAYDATNDRVLFNSGSDLLEWDIDTDTVNLLTPITDATGGVLTVTGLAFGNDTLYACRNIANEAIYEVDVNTGVASVFIDYADDSFDCGGLAFNPADGQIYMTNDDATPFGSGLFRMNPDGSGTLITAYPAGQTDIDGLAIGDGRAYFVIDEPGDLHVWDFAQAAFQAPLTSPIATSEVFSAGAWIGTAGVVVPESLPVPSLNSAGLWLLLLLALGIGLYALRR